MINNLRAPGLYFGLTVLMTVFLNGDVAANIDQTAVARSLVEVRGVNRIGREYVIATGFVINANGFVLTVGQQSLKKARSIVIAPLPDVGASYEVQQTHYHPSLELAVLHAPALRAQPLTMAQVESQDQAVFVPFVKPREDVARGSISAMLKRPVRAYSSTEHNFIQHNANISREAFGAPLLNERGLVIGINHLNPDLAINALERKSKPDGRIFAVPTAEIESFLRSKNIAFESVAPYQTPPSVKPLPASPSASTVRQPPPSPSAITPSALPATAPASTRQLQEALDALDRERRARQEAEALALQARQRANEMERLAKMAESKTAISEQEKEAARQAALAASVAAEEAEALAMMAQQRADAAQARELKEALDALNKERQARRDAEALAQKAREEAIKMERLALTAESRSAASEQEKEAARQAARLADAAAEEAETSATIAQQRADAAEERAEILEKVAEEKARTTQAAMADAAITRRNLYMVGGGGTTIAIVLIAAWLLWSRRSSMRLGSAEARVARAEASVQRARREVADAPRPAPFDCLLEGRDPKGRRHTVKIPADALGTADGVVIGRNPRYAAVVVDHEGISREHGRLTVVDGVLNFEDLNSTNGSFVNNTRAHAGQKIALHNGFVVKLGPISFNLTLTTR